MRRARLVLPYLCFLWAFVNFEVFIMDFDGGFLRSTPFRFLEFPMYTLARRKVIAIPYGSDILDLRRCRDTATRTAILQDYPGTGTNYREVERRVKHYARWASFIITGGIWLDFLPRFDLVVTNVAAIDVDEWSDKPRKGAKDSCSRGGAIRILHAPNHRHVKGTEFLVQACEELRAEGVPIELMLKERTPNSEIRRLMRDADIVASAFVMGCYELFAIEGMSMGKPVLNYCRPALRLICSAHSHDSECPILDTPVSRLKENIRRLADNPDLRERLGQAGRLYVEKYHSYEAVGQLFDKVIRKVWFGELIDFSPQGTLPEFLAKG